MLLIVSVCRAHQRVQWCSTTQPVWQGLLQWRVKVRAFCIDAGAHACRWPVCLPLHQVRWRSSAQTSLPAQLQSKQAGLAATIFS